MTAATRPPASAPKQKKGHTGEAANRYVFLFDEHEEVIQTGSPQWDDVLALLGGKGAGLAEMTRIKLPVPPGFTVTTRACLAYLEKNCEFPEGLWQEITEALHKLEAKSGKHFGSPDNPLLVSVRSGAKFSMPGMMDTVLNLGMNDAVAEGLVALTGDERFVFDAYRRLVQMFGTVVQGIEDEAFEDYLTDYKHHRNVQYDVELGAADWRKITDQFLHIYRAIVGKDFPHDPLEQLRLAIEAVFRSWNGKRAVDYRNAANIPHDLGTAVNVQSMVFGNLGQDSGSGVAFTRDPATGEKIMFGDYLMNAQGEDVVAGIRTPVKIAGLASQRPDLYKQFANITNILENHYHDMQDVEFTIENGKLWMLQTRNGKRTARAAIRIAVEMVNEGMITKDLAVKRVTPQQVVQLLHPQFDPADKEKAVKSNLMVATGVNASPGAAVGVAAFDADLAEQWGKSGRDVIMVRPETKPDDVHGMLAAKGILTSRGGATSHAAVVARQFGVPCVCGAEALEIDTKLRQLKVGGRVIREGDVISIDGSAGEVFVGQIKRVEPDFDKETYLQTLLTWADEFRRLNVYANADYPKDAIRARAYGAHGIGLCRTEHMFFQEERLPIVQAMILAEPNSKEEQAELDKLLDFQRDDFYGIFKAMDGLPVIIRLIDPPLHEFMPDHEQLALKAAGLRILADRPAELARTEALLKAVGSLREFNPMLGLRGTRLGLIRPAITRMQVRAIFEAACRVQGEGGTVYPEIMVAVTAHANEVKRMREIIVPIAEETIKQTGCPVDYKIGTMIELPRAAITADEMAKYAEFFSFGTNDLTQTTFGISRDDAEGKFLLDYVESGLLPENPFQVIDEDSVGYLINVATQKGRSVRPELEVGICGEHGGEPRSIDFCHRAGLNYVSCSPFRIPIARLAAAQAALKHDKKPVSQ
ncbi:MAG TPA: pyruvate, phosphate dikinase [Aggregatilineales bacterium]|nr:pyruvate, phosphate dikinase [Aggregatilineales bacterium]